jgi:hypothetical protein
MSLISGGVGGGAGALPDGYEYKLNQSNGALELWKGTEKIAEQNSDGSWFKTALTTGVGSFHLGSVHSIGSAGQNVVFKNEFTGLAFFPLWQGQSTDGTIIIEPSSRKFAAQAVAEPNGALVPAGTPIPYAVSFTPAASLSFTKIEVMPADTAAAGGTWVVEFTAGNVEIARVEIPSWTAGALLSIPFEYPLDVRAGDSIATRIIRKDTGALMQCRPGVTAAAPWRRTTSRTFTDAVVGTHEIGDIKEAYRKDDHNGWLLMDGRPVSSLTPTQQAAASSLGSGLSYLPDTVGKLAMGADGSAVFVGQSAGSLTIARSALPNFTLTGNTGTESNGHTHTTNAYTISEVTASDYATSSGRPHTFAFASTSSVFRDNGSTMAGSDQSYAALSSPDRDIDGLSTLHNHLVTIDVPTKTSNSQNANHTHGYTTTSLNGNVTQTTHLPPYIAFGKFIYLGL